MRLFELLLMTSLFIANAFAVEIDLNDSSLGWIGKKVTGQHNGKVLYKSGEVVLKDGKLAGGEFVVDMNSISVEDLQGEWATKFLTHMKSGDFFNVEKFPTSKLKITSVEGNKVKADLTIKGKTNSVSFPIVQNGSTYSGNLTFDRTKFDMVYNSGNFFKDLGDKMINDEVNVEFKFVVKNK